MLVCLVWLVWVLEDGHVPTSLYMAVSINWGGPFCGSPNLLFATFTRAPDFLDSHMCTYMHVNTILYVYVHIYIYAYSVSRWTCTVL